MEVANNLFKAYREGLPLLGRWRLTAYLAGGNGRTIYLVKEGHNLITTAGKQLIGDMLIDETGYDTGLTYQAEGTDDTAPAVGDTTLGAEAARKAVTSKSRSGNEITYSTFFTAAEANDNIKEAGIFGHSTASATPDSGILFAHWLVSFDNSGGNYDLTFDYILTIG